jgi:hypothetical protein
VQSQILQAEEEEEDEEAKQRAWSTQAHTRFR